MSSQNTETKEGFGTLLRQGFLRSLVVVAFIAVVYILSCCTGCQVDLGVNVSSKGFYSDKDGDPRKARMAPGLTEPGEHFNGFKRMGE